jgi:copper transport protein
MSASPGTSRVTALRRLALAVLVGCAAALLGFAAPASAHTDFVGSDPADGDVVDGPVSQIVIEFTGESTEAGDGFVVLDADGQLRRPNSVVSDDAKTFTLNFDPALSGGQIGVRWSVRAGDSHPIEGSFSFTAGGAVPTTTAPNTTTATSPDTTTAATAPPVTSAAPTAPPTTDMAGMAGMDDSSGSSQNAADAAIDMAAFLDVDNSRPGETTAGVGRTVTLLATVIALGGLAVAFTTLRGPTSEIEWLLRGVRLAGVALVIGATIEYVGVARIAGDSLSSAWSSSSGAATVMRLLAGVAIAAGIAATVIGTRARTPRPLSAAVDVDPDLGTAHTTGRSGSGQHSASEDGEIARWMPDRRSGLGLAGAVILVASFWFDGHTVTEGVRPLHALVNSVHVVAGSIWAGGVIAMAAIMWRRRRRSRPSGALDLVVRFSSIATVALGAVVAAGLVMALMIADSFSDLTGTEWGQTLLLKTAAAAVAMAFGAWNHFRLLPALEARPEDAGLQQTARSTVTAEAIVLAFVVVTTASLVAAAI